MNRTLLLYILFFVNQAFGQLASDFQVTTIEGRELNLYEDYLNKDESVVIILFFVDDPATQSFAPFMKDLYSEVKNEGINVEFISLSVSTNDTDATMAEYKAQYNYEWEFVSAEGGSLSTAQPYRDGTFGVYFGTPTIAVIAPDGTVNYVRRVFGDNAAYIENIETAIIESQTKNLSLDVSGEGRISGKLNIGTDNNNSRESLFVNGRVRISNVPSGTGDPLLINQNGDLVRGANTSSSRNSTVTSDLNTTIKDQQNQINQQQLQIDELTYLVEQLLVTKVNSKGNTYVLPLKQKAILAQNQPNPFHQNTIVDYVIPSSVTDAKIQVTSLDGQIIGIVKIDEIGKGQVIIKASTYPVGTYYYSLILDDEVIETKQMVLIR